jgi:ACT domain-containing protein
MVGEKQVYAAVIALLDRVAKLLDDAVKKAGLCGSTFYREYRAVIKNYNKPSIEHM